ncbi:hypothetical protein E2562_028296 [Oryza meyeriana var. granulata]|uniref:Uncharacterized protein n=1 Tax=Oryza meyeriana var. granulata TaxID=110450 RepID=A0A6G1E3E2_9ORYZ|nr:hypothetical protein E2562_028296 [Oryza meyeriana var. granulata]
MRPGDWMDLGDRYWAARAAVAVGTPTARNGTAVDEARAMEASSRDALHKQVMAKPRAPPSSSRRRRRRSSLPASSSPIPLCLH